MTKQKRDNNYYLQRLKKEHPALYANVKAGRINVSKARQLAGMGGSRTRLQELTYAWEKATAAERKDFLSAAGLSPAPAAPTTASSPASPATAAVFELDGRIQSWACKRIEDILARRHMTPGELADELGISRLNVSVISAVRTGTKVKNLSTIAAVERWVTDNTPI